MGQSSVKYPRKVYSQQGGGGTDPTIDFDRYSLIVTKKVEVYAFSNYDYYIGKGYEIEKKINYNNYGYYVPRSLKILVDINHLPIKSNVKILFSCKKCNEIKQTTFANFNIRKTDYCKKCALLEANSGENAYWRRMGGFTQETKDKMRITAIKNRKTGSNHHNWKDVKTNEIRIKERKLIKNIEFVKSCLKRDLYKCIKCESTIKLQVHHIIPYAVNLEIRFDIDNGITLCNICHKAYHSEYGNIKCNGENLKIFINNGTKFS